jgi:hypothetical protein
MHICAREFIYLHLYDEARAKAIRNFPTPRTLSEVQAFLGLTGYYCIFVQNFGAIRRPLTALTRKVVQFKWDPTQQEAFEELKMAVRICTPQL